MIAKGLSEEEQLNILEEIESRLDEDISVSETIFFLDEVKNKSPDIIARKGAILRTLEKKTKSIEDYGMLADVWCDLDNIDECERLHRKCERLAKSVRDWTTVARQVASNPCVADNEQDKRVKAAYIRAVRRAETEEEWAECARVSAFLGGIDII